MWTSVCKTTDSRNGAFFAPFLVFYSFINYQSVYACFFRPIKAGHGFTLRGYQNIRAFVIGLLGWGRPSDVSDFVMTIYVFAFNRMFGRWFSPDFRKKFLERIETKFDAASAVMFITFIVRLRATFFRRFIGYQFCGSRISARFAVCRRCFRNSVFAITTARLRIFATQTTTWNGDSIAAFADTQPLSILPFVGSRELNNEQSPKGQPEKILNARIFQIARNWFSIDSSHDVKANSFNVLIRLARDVQNLWRAVSILPQNTLIRT